MLVKACAIPRCARGNQRSSGVPTVREPDTAARADARVPAHVPPGGLEKDIGIAAVLADDLGARIR